jgi:hypothetical protein
MRTQKQEKLNGGLTQGEFEFAFEPQAYLMLDQFLMPIGQRKMTPQQNQEMQCPPHRLHWQVLV